MIPLVVDPSARDVRVVKRTKEYGKEMDTELQVSYICFSSFASASAVSPTCVRARGLNNDSSFQLILVWTLGARKISKNLKKLILIYFFIN